MAFILEHLLVSRRLDVQTHVDGDEIWFSVASEGAFQVMHAGRFFKYVDAQVVRHTRIGSEPEVEEPVGGIDDPESRFNKPDRKPKPAKDGLVASKFSIPSRFQVFDPHGNPFPADEITVADLERYRDRRGMPIGQWSYRLIGETKRYNPVEEANEKLSAAPGEIRLAVWEEVASESAPPLVNEARLGPSTEAFPFDLYRVGTFVAEITADPGWKATMRLLDPDGVAVASTYTTTLRHEIDLVALRKSRTANGRPRSWTLEVSPHGGGVVTGTPRVSAQVFGASRIATKLLNDRLLKLLGTDGRFIDIRGLNKDGEAQVRIKIRDAAAAETIEQRGLLESVLSREEQDPPLLATDIVPFESYKLYARDERPKDYLLIDVGSIVVSGLTATVGAASHLGGIPAVRLRAKVEGGIRFDFKIGTIETITLGRAQVKGGIIEAEIGLRLGEDGVPSIDTWVKDDLLDLSLDSEAILKASLLLPAGPTVAMLAMDITAIAEEVLDRKAKAAADAAFAHPDLAPTNLMKVMGAHLQYTDIRMEGDQVVVEYVAPLEHDPQPRDDYRGAIGREVDTTFGDGRIRFRPNVRPDTWAIPNLRDRIDHIVVVMMENRSFDHVLGYRSLAPLAEPTDGWTPELMAAIAAVPPTAGTIDPFEVRNLATAAFPANEQGKMTRLPKGVAHSFKAVTQQLSVRHAGPTGGAINGAEGFVRSFIPKIGEDNPKTDFDDRLNVIPNDVLGYYDGEQLPMYEYLARNYAYSDRFFCSHPGPTLPNRMYSLTGDLQYDRFGGAIVENNSGDNFLLSRRQTIFDVLTRHGVSWRIYESSPSVTMLRMFARYAGNDTDIVHIDRLEEDLKARGLPSFSFIEPAMHHHPQNDDHPDADMWRGQIFIRRVYEALRNLDSWYRTLLVITYDEHGGLYDHVIPPTADVYDPGGEGGGMPEVNTDVEGAAGPPAGDPPPPDDEQQPVTGGGGWLGRRNELGRTGPGDTVKDVSTEPAKPAQEPLFVPYGVRVPTFLVSPWTTPGPGPDTVLDFCSILKTVLARFVDEPPFMSDRVSASNTLESFITAPQARLLDEEPPKLDDLPVEVRRLAPDESEIETPPLSRRDMREGPVESHDVMGHVARLIGR